MRDARLPAAAAPFLAAGLLAACQAVGSDGSAVRRAVGSSASSDAVSPAVADSLRVSLEVPDRVAAGDSVPMALRVENAGDDPVELRLTGRPVAFDLIVMGEGGETVWRRLEGATVPQVLVLMSLAPGEALAFEDSWDQLSNAGSRVAPGTYTVRGELPAEGRRLASPAETLRIVPD